MVPRRVLKRKLYVISVPPRIQPDKVYDKLLSMIRTQSAEISIRDNRLFIELVGTEAEIKDTWYRIRNALQDLWDLYNLRSSREASIESIVKEAGRTFPPESLIYALRLRGFEARLSDDKQSLLANAPMELVVDVARRIAETIDEIRFRVKGSSAKRMIAALSVGLNEDPSKIIEYGVKIHVLEETEEGIVLREEWKRGLKRIAVMFKGVG